MWLPYGNVFGDWDWCEWSIEAEFEVRFWRCENETMLEGLVCLLCMGFGNPVGGRESLSKYKTFAALGGAKPSCARHILCTTCLDFLEVKERCINASMAFGYSYGGHGW